MNDKNKEKDIIYLVICIDPLLPNGSIIHSTKDVKEFKLVVFNALNHGVKDIRISFIDDTNKNNTLCSVFNEQDIYSFIELIPNIVRYHIALEKSNREAAEFYNKVFRDAAVSKELLGIKETKPIFDKTHPQYDYKCTKCGHIRSFSCTHKYPICDRRECNGSGKLIEKENRDENENNQSSSKEKV